MTPVPLPSPPWLAPPVGVADVDWLATLIPAGGFVVAVLALSLIIWRIRAHKRNHMSVQLDKLTASIASLEAAVSTNSADISHAVQLFKDNAAASVQLEADNKTITDLTGRLDAAVVALNGAHQSLVDAETPVAAA